jgi:hypothetical protein
MTKVNFPIRGAADAASVRQWRWLMAAVAAVFCGALWAATNSAEQVDSGWAVASPSPIATGNKASDAHQQFILRPVLEQSQPLLVKKPSPPPAVDTTEKNGAAEKSSTAVRVAARPDSDEGWRPIGTTTTTKGSATSRTPGPHLGAPIAVPKDEQDAECDCSGQTAAPAPKTIHAHEATSPLADAYGTASAKATSDDVEEDCQGSESTSSEIEAELKAIARGTADADDAEPADIEIESSEAPAESDATNTPATETTKETVKAKPPVVVPAEVVPPPPLTKQLLALRTRVRSVLNGYYRKQVNSQENDPWEVMHGMLAYGVHSRIRQGNSRGEAITSVGWLCYNKPCKGQTLMYVNPQGEVRAKYGVGLQGHLGQLLAMLAQCNVSADYPIHVGKKEFTIHDLIEAEQKTCYPKSELTFKLIALQHYIDLNDTWVNDQGVEWDMPRLVREELAQPIRGAACGGTHRLSGLSLAVKARVRRGEPLDGEYARADEFVKKYQQYAFRLQNRDGSLSTSWFRGAGDEDDIDRRIKTTGHILEWLCYSLSDEELRDQRTVRAVTYLANLMYSNYDNEWEIGPRSHATHALLLYDQRVFQPFDKEGTVAIYRGGNPEMARSNQQRSSKR